MKKTFLLVALILIFHTSLSAQQGLYEPIDLSKVKMEFTDFGKMWTFDDIPLDKWEKLYGFTPTEEWIEDVMKSALQFGRGCSAAFVSADGLIMTNHHCARGRLIDISKEGEDLLRDGFYAETLQDERKIPNLFVDQLITIEDVTEEVIAAINAGKDNAEKVENRRSKILEIEKRYSEETGLRCQVVTLYNGGKYSLHAYKRYNDIRVVLSPDFQIAATGWDWDNFTYPRYELDFMFLRAYDENGKPVKSPHFFKWSEKGIDEGELMFTVGRPGNTDRLLSYEQLEYFRDVTYPQDLIGINGVYQIFYDMYFKYPERESVLLNRVMGVGNWRKSRAGGYLALRDEYIMKKKRDFQKNLIAEVKADPELNKNYGHLWENIKTTIEELKSYPEARGYNLRSFFAPGYFAVARDLKTLAEQLQIDEDKREADYKNDKLAETIAGIFPADFNYELEDGRIAVHAKFLNAVFNGKDKNVKNLYGGLEDKEVIKATLAKSEITTAEKVKALADKGAEAILNSNDPFIKFIVATEKKLQEVREKVQEVNNTLAVLNQQLGEAVFAVYGDEIPPDATGTLRISDGVIAGYEYNGTIAPGKTTYYGLYDRYNSFTKETYPWGLHERWKTPAPGLDLKTFIGFASTNDIVGGNSGSSMINANKEVIGLVHDGNLESLAGAFIFNENNNRAVATDSWGLLEAMKHVFKTDRIVKELKSGKITE